MTKDLPSLRAGVSVFKFSLYFALKFKKSQKIQNFPKIVQKSKRKKDFLKNFTNFLSYLPKFTQIRKKFANLSKL